MKTLKILFLFGILLSFFMACTKENPSEDQELLAQITKQMASDDEVPIIDDN
jgi:hypothetical protein